MAEQRRSRGMIINAFLMEAGHHEGAWRLPESNPRAQWDPDHWIDLARTAEAAGVHSLFLADVLAVQGSGLYRPVGGYDPVILMTLLAGATSRIGLISTISVTYNDPYGLARRLATLDHLSGGRAGWNIVTSVTDEEAANFGLSGQLDYGTRYARAQEFLEVCTRLWDSWPAEAIVADKAAGRYTRPGLIKPIEHHGTYFRVAGPMNVPQPPQGHPLLVQAGSSAAGIDFAVRWADLVFTAQQRYERAHAFYTDVKRRAAESGRDPGTVKVLPGVVPIIGRTMQEAQAKAERLDDHIVVEYAVEHLEFWLGRSLAGLDLDGPFPGNWFEEPPMGMVSRSELILDMARKESLTIRQVLRRLGGGRGHTVVVGTPETIADHLENWFRNEAADGFNVMPPRLPADLEEFVELVLPILADRGLFDPRPAGDTLRERMGLPGPDTHAGRRISQH